MISCHTFNKLESNIKLPHLLFYSPIFSRHFVVGLRFFVASKNPPPKAAMRRLSQSKDENGEDVSVFDSILPDPTGVSMEVST